MTAYQQKIKNYATFLETEIANHNAKVKSLLRGDLRPALDEYNSERGRVIALTKARDKLYSLFPELVPAQKRAKESRLAQKATSVGSCPHGCDHAERE